MTTVASVMPDQLGEDGPLAGRRVLQDGVKRGDGRDIERPDEVEDVCAVLAAPDPVLVLDRDDADASVQRAGGPQVVVRLVLANPMVDFDRIRATACSGGWRTTISRLLVFAARSLVKAAMPQRRGGYVETKAVRTMAWLLLGVVGALRRTVARCRWSTTEAASESGPTGRTGPGSLGVRPAATAGRGTLGGSHLGGAGALGARLDLELDPLAADEAIKVER